MVWTGGGGIVYATFRDVTCISLGVLRQQTRVCKQAGRNHRGLGMPTAACDGGHLFPLKHWHND